MIGDQTNFVWGVCDLRPRTNFPDIRMRCAVHSASAGSVMVIPQPKGLVRLYIQLPIEVQPGQYLDRSKITPDSILSTARKILHPYTLETDHIEWYTGYHIGQRMTESFGRAGRIFLAGDACHTHSPKAGQGMNTSMQDTWNLCWKLGSVLTGTARRDLLETYATEREVVARTLIEFDTKFSKLFSSKPAAEADLEKDGVDLKEFKDVFAKSAYSCRILAVSLPAFHTAAGKSQRGDRNVPAGFPGGLLTVRLTGLYRPTQVITSAQGCRSATRIPSPWESPTLGRRSRRNFPSANGSLAPRSLARPPPRPISLRLGSPSPAPGKPSSLRETYPSRPQGTDCGDWPITSTRRRASSASTHHRIASDGTSSALSLSVGLAPAKSSLFCSVLGD